LSGIVARSGYGIGRLVGSMDTSLDLTTTSYAVLAPLAVHPWSTYELARQWVRYFRYVWPRTESAIYREVKRLAAMGSANSRTHSPRAHRPHAVAAPSPRADSGRPVQLAADGVDRGIG